MSLEEEGCYIRLMAFCWREGSIPADLDKLSRLCKGASTTVLRVVVDCFMPTPNDPTRLLHKRHEAEREKQREWREKSSEGGKKSAEKRAEKRAENPENKDTSKITRVVEPPYQPKGNISFASSSSSSSTKSEEQQSSHEQRKEQKAPDVTPITPSMVAQRVLTECCLASEEVLSVITDVVKAESKLPGYDPTTLRDKMITAWREFEAASPKLTQFAPGAAKFFGEARWRNKSNWGWKEGMEPPAARRYINTDSPSLVDKVRAQLGPEALAERDARISENKLNAISTTF
jgi:uncharacterized protein YdaU (DUF1376 family)